jgi:potassium voltage-gated channel Shaw-related subfamily C member 1
LEDNVVWGGAQFLGVIALFYEYRAKKFSIKNFRDTQETLAVIESLDLDSDPPTQEEIAKKFGWEDDFYSGSLSTWQKLKPKIWALFDEPWSSKYARVGFEKIIIFAFCLA